MPRVSHNIFGPNLFQLFVDDFGGINAAAQYLDESPRTVKRWMQTERVPRSAVLALYWESRYGESQSNCDLVNEIRMYFRAAADLTDRLNAAHAAIRELQRLSYGTANQPMFKEFHDALPMPPTAFCQAQSPRRDPGLSSRSQCDAGDPTHSTTAPHIQAGKGPNQTPTPQPFKTMAA